MLIIWRSKYKNLVIDSFNLVGKRKIIRRIVVEGKIIRKYLNWYKIIRRKKLRIKCFK